MDKTKTQIIAVSGLKNSGKTGLIEAIIPLLAKNGIKTAVIKHHGHRFGEEIPDKPGTDTYRFLANGASGTVIYDDELMMCVRRTPAKLPELIALFPDADLVIIEGAKSDNYPRIAMLRSGHALTSDPVTLLCAVTDPDFDATLLPAGLPRFDYGDFESVAKFIEEKLFCNNC